MYENELKNIVLKKKGKHYRIAMKKFFHIFEIYLKREIKYS